ncbi:MAG: sulfur carrier protein ThiS [Acidobacteria bacterium]|nr:sulfur carrier protein ThiS [Acidobacteriota bacterium]
MSTDISITINGEERAVPSGLNIRSLIAHLGLDVERVAVEMDRKLVRKGEWEGVEVKEGAMLEVVTFVGGG